MHNAHPSDPRTRALLLAGHFLCFAGFGARAVSVPLRGRKLPSHFVDVWDFDPKDWTTAGRSFQGEAKTRVANALLPGAGFEIDSVETRFTQSQNDETVAWAGGVPKSEPDRIAALDAELKKPNR